ncbi:hypothetical protein pmac_cds_268 [Pandoravirus macleodensis]|uniref:Uncharacterized protein n=1 Tax=Pandoravirus macleodensis TaxID=2107707 RepID=A0A2U7UET7_9VIRU|nr:hypothetical protein pmac_cds_268 [Pandoravirus macleodensis]AVK76956.1 hypothetical protein pmac_cds_268 [Pandoravirus macleodensis]
MGDSQTVMHFVRSARDQAAFQRYSPRGDERFVRVGVVDVGRARTLAMPQPAVDCIVLWTTAALANVSAACVSSHTDAPTAYKGCRPVFKSAIQKCVRRGMPDDCARFAWGLVHAGGLDQLLRRALVILVEDAIALPEVPVLVWLMAAHAKGFCLDATDIGLVVNAMYRAAALPVRDCMPRPEPSVEARARLGDSANHPLVDSILLRVCYGGTPGDMRMLARAASLWQARLGDAAGTAWHETVESLVNAVGSAPGSASGAADGGTPLPDVMASLVASVPIEAADFHCFPHICAEVAQATQGRYTAEVVREAIWHHRSGVNLKRPWINPATPTALESTTTTAAAALVEWTDDRVDAAALVRTAQCWTVVCTHLNRTARRAIDRVSATVAHATNDSTDLGHRTGQKRSRTMADIDKGLPAVANKDRRVIGPTQRSIQSFFRPGARS